MSDTSSFFSFASLHVYHFENADRRQLKPEGSKIREKYINCLKQDFRILKYIHTFIRGLSGKNVAPETTATCRVECFCVCSAIKSEKNYSDVNCNPLFLRKW